MTKDIDSTPAAHIAPAEANDRPAPARTFDDLKRGLAWFDERIAALKAGHARMVELELASRGRAQGGTTQADSSGIATPAAPTASADAVVEARNQALEDAALACENERVEVTGHKSDDAYNLATKHCSDAIRALKSGVLRTGEGADRG